MAAIVLRGDAAHLPLEDGSADLLLCSPPYFGLRSYSDGGEIYEGQIGSEETPQAYIAALLDCTREWMRVLKPGGSIFVNLGDKYSTYTGANWGNGRSLDGHRGQRKVPDGGPVNAPGVYGIPYKSLMGLPWRYALRCVDDLGLTLRAEIIWEKPNGTGIAADRFRRVHEHALHWYRGPWRDVHHASPRSAHYGARNGGAHRQSQPEHVGTVGVQYWEDDGTRLARSVMRVANLHQQTPLHPTEKPIGILDPLITYACPPGGLVVDPFAGSGSTLDAARASGRRAIGVEMHEPYAEKAARRLSQMVLKAS